MVEVRNIDRSMIPEVHGLLRELDTKLTEDDWERAFNYTWVGENNLCGYGLFAGGKAVGFLGLIFSRRWIDNRIEAFCNMTSWFVKREYRGYTLSLIQPVLKLKDHTITDLTPSSAVFNILKRGGFRELDTGFKILLLSPHRRARAAAEDPASVIQDERLIEEQLNDSDRKLFEDHRPYKCGHLLVRDGQRYCYLVYTRVASRMYSYGYIHYVSDLDVFTKYSRAIRSAIAASCESWIVVVDLRMVRSVRLPSSLDSPFRSPKLYKPASSLQPAQIDNLYTELTLLHLDAMPGWWEIKRELLAVLVNKRYDPYPR
jgi:hypothetical protein